jgi:hypothetical protein
MKALAGVGANPLPLPVACRPWCWCCCWLLAAGCWLLQVAHCILHTRTRCTSASAMREHGIRGLLLEPPDIDRRHRQRKENTKNQNSHCVYLTRFPRGVACEPRLLYRAQFKQFTPQAKLVLCFCNRADTSSITRSERTRRAHSQGYKGQSNLVSAAASRCERSACTTAITTAHALFDQVSCTGPSGGLALW